MHKKTTRTTVHQYPGTENDIYEDNGYVITVCQNYYPKCEKCPCRTYSRVPLCLMADPHHSPNVYED